MAVADDVVVRLSVQDRAYTNRLNINQQNFAQTMARIEADAARAGLALESLGNRGAPALDKNSKAAKRAAAEARKLAAANTNLAAQFQDIGVQLAGGTSPFLIIAQQLPQITAASTSLTGVVGGLGLAFRQLVSPVGLAVTAFVLAAGVAIDYFSAVLDKGDDSEKTLKAQADLIKRVADRWGDAVPAIKAYADQLQRAADNSDLQTATGIVIGSQFAEAERAIGRISDAVVNSFPPGSNAAKDFARALYEARQAAKLLAEEQARGGDATDETAAFQKAFDALLRNNSIPIIGNLRDAVNDGAEAYRKFAEQAERAAEAASDARFQNSIQDFYKNNPIGGLSPVVSAGGKFMNDAEFQQYRSDRTLSQYQQENPKDFLKTRAVSDRIAERIQLLDDDFAKKLSQLLVEFPELKIASALRTIEEQKKIYDSGVRPAAKPGNSLHEKGLAVDISAGGKVPSNIQDIYRVARALGIEFPVKNDPLHAQPIGARGQVGASGLNARTGSDIFSGSLEGIQRQISLLEAATSATQGLTAGTDQFEVALAKARAEQEIMNSLQREGYELKDGDAEKISLLAEKYANLTVAQKSSAQAARDLAREQEQFADFRRDVLGGFISDLVKGKDASDALADALAKVGDRLLDIALDSLFSGKSGGAISGFIGSLLGFRERGGPVRKGQPYVVGEKRPELFVPDTNGKIIPSVPSASAMGRSSGGAVSIRVIGEEGPMFRPYVEATSRDMSVQVTQAGLAGYDKNMDATMGKRVSRAQARQQ